MLANSEITDFVLKSLILRRNKTG